MFTLEETQLGHTNKLEFSQLFILKGKNVLNQSTPMVDNIYLSVTFLGCHFVPNGFTFVCSFEQNVSWYR